MLDPANKLALVTGANGFLGRHTALHLSQQGWDVIGLGHGSWPAESPHRCGLSEWHSCDVTLDNLILYAREPAAIFHCAGSGGVGLSFLDPVRDYRKTVEGTLQVLEFIRLHAPRARLVYPSSAGVYGQVKALPIPEDAPLTPVSPYGVHKKMTEDLIQSYSRHFGVNASIIRFFSLYGPELRKQLLWDACKKATLNETTFPGTGLETRDWLHVSDAVSLSLSAMNHASIDCPVINGGFGKAASVREIITSVFAQLCPNDPPKFTGLTRHGDPQQYQAEISRAKSMGWEPRIDWRTGVRDYVHWFLNEPAI